MDGKPLILPSFQLRDLIVVIAYSAELVSVSLQWSTRSMSLRTRHVLSVEVLRVYINYSLRWESCLPSGSTTDLTSTSTDMASISSLWLCKVSPLFSFSSVCFFAMNPLDGSPSKIVGKKPAQPFAASAISRQTTHMWRMNSKTLSSNWSMSASS